MSKKHAPVVSFVVLNWNGLADTKECIASIKSIDYPNKEVIIVDNGSSDGSKEYFSGLDGIIFIDLPDNTGFTGGHIAGREKASGEYIALINNDLVLDKKWLTQCLETFERHPQAAVVGGKAFKWNNQNPSYDTSNEFYSFQEVNPETGNTRTLLTGEVECRVDSISGAALLVKQSALEGVGYLDNDFFAYYEETDLIARLIRAGKEAYFCPNAHTWHKVGASTSGDSSFYLYMMHRNRYFYAFKNFDDAYLRQFLKNYRNEAFGALLRYLRNRGDVEAKCRLGAYRWTRQHKDLLVSGRKKTQALGETYSKLLGTVPHEDVTVIIPCYNYGNYVSEAIDSVLNQSVLPKRIIVIDDGSTDDTKNVLEKFKHNPLIEIVYKKNSGVVETKNLGIDMSQTYWSLFLDADDMLSSSFLKDTLTASRNGTKDIIYTDMRLFGATNDIFRARPYSVHTLLKTNYINNSALIKTSLLKQVGGYKTEMAHGLEDWELYITLVEAGAKPQYLPAPLVKYRQHDGALSRNGAVIQREKQLLNQIKSLHKPYYRKHGYYKTLLIHFVKFLAYCVRYPGVVLVILGAFPRAIKLGLIHIYSKGLDYVQNKIGISRN